MNRDENKVLLCILNSFADSIRNFSSFSNTFSDVTILITNDDKSSKAEISSALYGLGNTTDMDDFFFQFYCIRINTHLLFPSSLESKASFACCLSQGRNTAMENVSASVENNLSDTLVDSTLSNKLANCSCTTYIAAERPVSYTHLTLPTN